MKRRLHSRAERKPCLLRQGVQTPYSYTVLSSPSSPPTGRLSKELRKMGHISKNNGMGCVCVPAYHLPNFPSLIFFILHSQQPSFFYRILFVYFVSSCRRYKRLHKKAFTRLRQQCLVLVVDLSQIC